MSIELLYARYNWAIDSNDARGWACTFVEDGAFYGSMTLVGHEEMQEFVRSRQAWLDRMGYVRTQHWTQAIRFVRSSATQIEAQCSMLMLADSVAGGRPRVVANGAYDDVLVKAADTWLFQSRRAMTLPPARL